jgi:hypothetical protein
MTLMPLTVVNDSIVARADPFTVTEWTPKRLVNQVATLRDALTVTESLAVRLVVGDTATLSPATPFFAYWDWAVLPAEPRPAGIWLAPASAEASAALCTCFLLSAQKP